MIIGNPQNDNEYLLTIDAAEFTLLDVGEVKKHIEDNCFNKEIYNIVVDLEKVKYIDSGGLGFLLGMYKKLIPFNGKLLIKNPQQHVETTLKMTKLDVYLKTI